MAEAGKSVLEVIAESAAREVLKQYKADERKAKKKKAFSNTNLLLEHYLDLKNFCDNAVFESPEMVADDTTRTIYQIIDEVSGEEISVRSIKRSKEVTLLMMNHIDTALDILYKSCEDSKKKDMQKKYKALRLLHFDPLLQEYDWTERLCEVSDRLECSESTVRRWRGEMVNKLGIYLFGLDGLNLLG